MTSDSTQMNSEPSSVTAQSGMLSSRPTSSIADAISAGSVDASIAERPDAPMIVWIAPCAIENRAVISSMP